MSKFKLPTAAILLVALIGAAPLTASAPVSVSAATVLNSIKVQSINVKMNFDGLSLQPPVGQYTFMYNNTTYVPLRFMSYALQKSVSWDAKNIKVTIAEPNSSELVVIKEYLMNATTASTSVPDKSLMLSKVNASYVFNGSVKSLPAGQSSYMLNGTLYVPLRFLSELVGQTISWDQKRKAITAKSTTYQEQNGGGTSLGNSGTANTGKSGSTSSSVGGGGAAGGGTPTYEQITNSTEAKLSALRLQSSSTLMSLALQYLSASDDATKASLKAQGQQQLSSFTASFNSIVAEAEQNLKNNGYSSSIIDEYKEAFLEELENGKAIAEGLGN